MFDPTFEETVLVTQVVFSATDVGGIGIIEGQIPGGQVPPGIYWLVEVETFKTDSSTLTPTYELFASTDDDIQLRDFGASFLNGDATATESANQPGQPIRFWPQESLLVRFAGGDVGFTASVYLQIRATRAKGAAGGQGPEVVMPMEPKPQTPPQGGWNAGEGTPGQSARGL